MGLYSTASRPHHCHGSLGEILVMLYFVGGVAVGIVVTITIFSWIFR